MSTFPHGFAGVTIWPIRPGRMPTIELDSSAVPPNAARDGATDAVWARQSAANPRLFDGPILSVTSFDPEAARVMCRRDSYKRLSVGDSVATGVVLLAVNAVLIARDARGAEHVLLGRRSPQVRTYGAMWELTPAGGLEPPDAPPRGVVPHAHVLTQLEREMHEEAGIRGNVGPATPVAFYSDDRASSFNIVYMVRSETPLDALRAGAGERHWDCDAIRWLPRAEARAFDRAEGAGTIDASRAVLRFLGWVA
ncbi:MAG: NUDIX hydrolase [Phycisphaerales bacterium]